MVAKNSSVPIQNDHIPVRFNIGVMLFLASLVTCMIKVNISVNLLAMVLPTTGSTTGTEPVRPSYGPQYAWDNNIQTLILVAYFIGYLTSTLFGGLICQWYGERYVVFVSLIFSAFFTFLSPIAASFSCWHLFGIRYLIGFVGGVVQPALHNLISRWAPIEEKGKFVGALLGGNLGTVFTWSVVGKVIESLGWKWAFYIPGLFILFISFVWLYFVADSPDNHPRISEKEKHFIRTSLGETVSTEKQIVPYFKILTTIPFWALLFLHYGSLWGPFFLLNCSPKYMHDVLKFDLLQSGTLSALPHLARTIFGLGFGAIGDYLRRNNIVSVTIIRKSFTIFSHIIPGLCLIAMGFAVHPNVSVALMTLSLGFNGASAITSLQNSQDLAPNFSGILYGIINFTATTNGIVSPLLLNYLTNKSNTINQWHKIFFVGAGVYISTAIIFMIFGSAVIQRWNAIEPTKQKSKVLNLSKI